MFLPVILLIIGFVLLIKGADLLVDGASNLAKLARVSPLLIGLTLVSFGTSLPELIINIFSAWRGVDALGFGNIVGANLANIGLIVGLIAVLTPLKLKSSTIRTEIPFVVLSAVVVWALVFGKGLVGAPIVLSRGDGLILLIFFGIFAYYLLETALRRRKRRSRLLKNAALFLRTVPRKKSIFLAVAGIACLFAGGHLIVNSATKIAEFLHISRGLVGLTIIALGTTLPELTTSLVAVLKKKKDIAVGNLVGSIVFNTFFILGVVSLISPVVVESYFYFDLGVLILMSLLLFLFCVTNKKIEKTEGFILLFVYLAYILFVIYRG